MADVVQRPTHNMPKAPRTGSYKGTPKKAEKAQQPIESNVDDAESKAHETNGDLDNVTNGDTHTNGEVEESTADEGTEAIPAGSVDQEGRVVDDEGHIIGHVNGDKATELSGSLVDKEGDILDAEGNIIGTADLTGGAPEAEKPEAEKPDLAAPFGVQDNGEITNATGAVVGKLTEGSPQELVGTAIKEIDPEGHMKAESGSTVGKAEISPELLEESAVDGASVAGSKLPDQEKLAEVDPVPEDAKDAEAPDAEAPDAEAPDAEVPDLSILRGKKVNKLGKIVDENGTPFGQLVEGEAKKLVGRKVDAKGAIWDDNGNIIGKAELLPETEREAEPSAPFEDFPDAILDKSGNAIFEGKIVGKLIEGDPKKLEGKKVDADGDVLDRNGNSLGKVERYQEEEEVAPEPEKTDLSILAGKRVNKAGYLVDTHGSIFGRLVEGDPKKLAGKMSDNQGQIWNDGGSIVGRAELVPESEREGQKEGPFATFDSPKVAKDGKVVDSSGVTVGRVIEGDAKKLYGKQVDDDGDILDSNGNAVGKAERWEEEEKEEEVQKSIFEGLKVNRQGEVVDSDGNIIAKLTEGEAAKCSGRGIDSDGDVYNSKNQVIGHVTLLEDIPEPEPEVAEEPKESEEEVEKKKQLEQDKKLASQMAMCIQQSLDKVQPILKMITEAIDEAERKPKEELDEQKLVDTVRPLLEQGGQILQEANGVIRGLDPDGRIAANAKHKTASREATPEEYRLADVLKELTTNVTQTIDAAKKKIAGMPHAKKELNPLWNLLAEPLGQILAAVGLLLSGVLGLVGRLLSGLGLGGLLDNLLGGLGIKGILEGLGLGMVTKSLTGKK